MATKPDIELVALTKRFGDAVAVDTVSLRIPAGSYCCLLGPSGCGKTTTLRVIAGHEESTEGEIILVSRVGAEAGLRKSLERWFQPAARKRGWRTEFAWERYSEWTTRTPSVALVERRAMPPFGHFSFIRFRKVDCDSAKPAAALAG